MSQNNLQDWSHQPSMKPHHSCWTASAHLVIIKFPSHWSSTTMTFCFCLARCVSWALVCPRARPPCAIWWGKICWALSRWQWWGTSLTEMQRGPLSSLCAPMWAAIAWSWWTASLEVTTWEEGSWMSMWWPVMAMIPCWAPMCSPKWTWSSASIYKVWDIMSFKFPKGLFLPFSFSSFSFSFSFCVLCIWLCVIYSLSLCLVWWWLPVMHSMLSFLLPTESSNTNNPYRLCTKEGTIPLLHLGQGNSITTERDIADLIQSSSQFKGTIEVVSCNPELFSHAMVRFPISHWVWDHQHFAFSYHHIPYPS